MYCIDKCSAVHYKVVLLHHSTVQYNACAVSDRWRLAGDDRCECNQNVLVDVHATRRRCRVNAREQNSMRLTSDGAGVQHCTRTEPRASASLASFRQTHGALCTREHTMGTGATFGKANRGVFQFVAYCTVQSCSFCTKRVNGPCSWSAYRHFLRLFAFDRRGLSLPSKPLVSTHFIVRLQEGFECRGNTHNNLASDLI